jgi:cytochrome d ubiquinol oxidase subunit II
MDPANNLTIANASSSPYTLTLMSWVALLVVPFVLGYQAWSYWVFRRRLSRDHILSSRSTVPPWAAADHHNARD